MIPADGRRTLANRYWDPAADRICLIVDSGKAAFYNRQIRPLV